MSIEIKKCPYCGREYKEGNSITQLIISGPKNCYDECMDIQKLQDLLKEYFQNFLLKKGSSRRNHPWSQATQVSATRSLNTIPREMGFVNPINSVYDSIL